MFLCFQFQIIFLLGYAHEQQRDDREKFVELDLENVQDLGLSSKDFDKGGAGLNKIAGKEYDYESIMHYTNPIPDRPIFKAKGNPAETNRMGWFYNQNNVESTLSPLDRKKLQFYCNVSAGIAFLFLFQSFVQKLVLDLRVLRKILGR